MYDRIRKALAQPRADLWILVIATLLVAPSIPTGLAADDFLHELVLSGSNRIPGFHRNVLDLFRFASLDANRNLMNDGVFPWWTDPDVRFAFFRPVASITHWLDQMLWPANGPLLHIHSILWSLAALLGVRALYRAVDDTGKGATWAASLALALYALDDTRGPPVAWVANRAELVGCALSVWAITLHHRSADGNNRRATWLAPACLGVALFASEGSIAVTAYLFAHALFLEDGPLTRRLVRLAPYAAVVLAWSALYRSLGYGVRGSGVYFDPIASPVEFFTALPARFSMLWLAQLGGPWAEGWNMYPVMFPPLAVAVAALAVLAMLGAVLLFGPLVHKDKIARFWALGAVLATIPACTAFPADRLLPWVGIGAMGVTARFFAAFVEGTLPQAPFYGPISRVGAASIIVVHLVAGPLQLPLRARGIVQIRETLERADRSVPSDASVANRVIVYVNPPADPLASYIPIRRAALGIPFARLQRWLVTGSGASTFERLDDRTLRVRIEGGLLKLPSEILFRDIEKHPFVVGDDITLDELRVTIAEVTPDGRPLEYVARFSRPLDDPTYLWLIWKNGSYAPFTPPAIGSKIVIPSADWLSTAYGPDSPITKALDKRPAQGM
jgi:hypothetical protein